MPTGRVRLVTKRGYDLVLNGVPFETRRIQAYLRFANNATVSAVLDTGAHFSFLPQDVWERLIPREERKLADPDDLVWHAGGPGSASRCFPGTALFETAVHLVRGIGLGAQQAIRCDLAQIRARVLDDWGGDSGWLQIPALLGHTAHLQRDQRPQDVLLGFAGILDRATLHFDYRGRNMTLDFPD